MVIVYSSPKCFKCNFIKQQLKQNNITYVDRDVTEEKNRTALGESGIMSLPAMFYKGEYYTFETVASLIAVVKGDSINDK